MSTYTPDAWVVVDISTKDETIRKILAGWFGGYLGGDSWKLSSGVTSTAEYPDRYEFTNESGSLYICYRTVQRLTGMTGSMLSSWKKQISETTGVDNPVLTIEVVNFTE